MVRFVLFACFALASAVAVGDPRHGENAMAFALTSP